jgi:threonine/homoserine/homoserine lactone efflux protein
MAAFLFGSVCLMLGALGAAMIESVRVLSIYGVAVLGFAAWVCWDAYQRSRAGQGEPRPRGTLP